MGERGAEIGVRQMVRVFKASAALSFQSDDPFWFEPDPIFDGDGLQGGRLDVERAAAEPEPVRDRMLRGGVWLQHVRIRGT